jgi:hypothetical protein
MRPACPPLLTLRRLAAAGFLSPLLLGAWAAAMAADPASAAAQAKARAVTLEAVAGSTVKRVVLSAKAAERLDVQTREVSEQVIQPTLMVGGVVVDPSAAGADAGKASAGGAGAEVWIRVAYSPVEWGKVTKDGPARIHPLQTQSGVAQGLTARPSGLPPQDNARSGMLALFYIAPAAGSRLMPGDRVRVEAPLAGSTDRHKVVPYAAVYYDPKGVAWVYVNTAPLTFMRQRITIERVIGDLALLSSGPEVGTRVASVGAALLYGAEVFGK